MRGVHSQIDGYESSYQLLNLTVISKFRMANNPSNEPTKQQNQPATRTATQRIPIHPTANLTPSYELKPPGGTVRLNQLGPSAFCYSAGAGLCTEGTPETHVALRTLRQAVMSFRALCFDSVALDLNIYNLWLQGMSVQNITRRRLSSMPGAVSASSWSQVALQDTQDQCRVFETLRHFLERPHLLSTQSLCQLAVPFQQYMVEMFYRFNDSVIREV
jgi:hypothetical protein